MIEKIDVRLQRFIATVRDTLFSDRGIGVAPQFYMTHYCNLSCPGCYMAAGPIRPKVCIPTADIGFYLREFKKNSGFVGVTTFSGGEIFSLPTEYLKYNIQDALDLGIYTEIKTNGSWVDNPARSDRIFEMLGGLSVPRVANVSAAKVQDYLRRYTRSELQSMGRDKIMEMLCAEFGTIAVLDMAVSVDNKIHPARSAQWFAKIATRIGRDDNLAQKIELNGLSFKDSFDFFMQHVIKNPQLGVYDLHSKGGILSYRVGKCSVQSGFADFLDTTAAVPPETSADIVAKSVGGDSFLPIFFWPDRTASFEDSAMRTVGRVPYVDANGKCKGLNQLIQDMAIKLMSDYKDSISR